MVGFDPFRLAIGGLLLNEIVQPHVAFGVPLYFPTGALVDDDGFDRLAAAERQRLVDCGFERDRLAAAHLLVGGKYCHRASVDDPLLHAFRGEAAEHDRMDRANTRAGLHGDDGFDRHRHVNQHAVAFFDLAAFQAIGHHADTAVEFLVGDLAHFAVVGLEYDRDLVRLGL